MSQIINELKTKLLECKVNDESDSVNFQSLLAQIEDQITNQPFDEKLAELHIEALYFVQNHPPDQKSNLLQSAREYLSKTPHNFWIRYHLACYLFDEGEYAESLKAFTLLPNPELYLISIDQKWRLVKLTEIYACIFLHLSHFEEANRHLTNLLVSLASMEPVEIPIHIELFNTLKYLRENPTSTYPLDQIQYWESKFDFSNLKG